jgi:WXG100 family type VII secretion target
MTSGFDTTPVRLMETAKDCDATAAQLAAELAALKTYVVGLNGPWLGSAMVNFQQLMDTYQMHSANLNEALTFIGTGLRQNANNYEAGEHQNTQSISSINNDFPPANLS